MFFFLKFKEELRTLFPDWNALKQCGEVIRFACGIPTASVHMMQFVYDVFIDSYLYYVHGSFKFIRYEIEGFLISLSKEVGLLIIYATDTLM